MRKRTERTTDLLGLAAPLLEAEVAGDPLAGFGKVLPAIAFADDVVFARLGIVVLHAFAPVFVGVPLAIIAIRADCVSPGV